MAGKAGGPLSEHHCRPDLPAGTVLRCPTVANRLIICVACGWFRWDAEPR